MVKSTDKKIIIQLVAQDAYTEFKIPIDKAIQIATTAYNHHEIPINDPQFQHNGSDGYITKMLLKYHVCSKQHILKCLK